MRRGARRALATALALALALAACGEDPAAGPAATPDVLAAGDVTPGELAPGDAAADAGPTTTLTTAALLAPGPHPIGWQTLTLVDDTRPTPATAAFAGAPERTLVVEVWYPAAGAGGRDVHAAAGAFPLVVHSHGFLSDRKDSEGLARFLAHHGFVVAAADYPLTGRAALGGTADARDVVNQPGDVSFILDALLARSADDASLLAGAIDPERIALSGVSLGGMTTLLAGLHPDFRDPRVKALAPLAPATCFLPLRTFETALPLMIVHGDRDAIAPYAANAVPAYAAAKGRKLLVDLVGGTHTGMADATAELFDSLDHADEVGCVALGGAIDTSDPALIDGLLEPGEALLNDACPAPCADPSLVADGMGSLRQRDLIFVAVRAFLEGELVAGSEGLAFLATRFAPDNTDVQVDSAP